MTPLDAFIVAAEPSGDQLGADLVEALKRENPDIVLAGIGGPQMAKAGLQSLMSINGLAVLGFVEGLKAYPFVLRKVREAVDLILRQNPRSVVLIDSWGFMVRVAKSLKAKGYTGTIVKYVAPQVWATRPGRAKILAQHVDHLLSTQPMDADHFEPVGLPQTFVGNPVLDQSYTQGSKDRFILEQGLSDGRPILGLFFGSRDAEIDRVGPAILNAYQEILAHNPDIQAVCVIAEPVRGKVQALLEGQAVTAVPQSDFLDAIASLDVALACSGTVTTQLAAAGVPTVVLYKLSPLTYLIASRLFKPRYISLVNISADGDGEQLDPPLMPEFLQDNIQTAQPADAALKFLESPDLARSTSQALIQETQRMGAGFEKASDRAAAAILELLN